jgi:hypothetical protein
MNVSMPKQMTVQDMMIRIEAAGYGAKVTPEVRAGLEAQVGKVNSAIAQIAEAQASVQGKDGFGEAMAGMFQAMAPILIAAAEMDAFLKGHGIIVPMK